MENTVEEKKERNKKRYRLHSLIRKEGYVLSTSKRTIYVPFDYSSLSENVQKLRDAFGYAIQTEIPQEKQPLPKEPNDI